MRTTPTPPDPSPGPSTTLEEDAQSEASGIDSTPPDPLLSMESDVIEDLRVNEDFVRENLTEEYDEVIDLTEIVC